jgi:hypothetical protein
MIYKTGCRQGLPHLGGRAEDGHGGCGHALHLVGARLQQLHQRQEAPVRLLAPAQHLETFGIVQGTCGIAQGTFSVAQGTFGIVQGTFRVAQGASRIVHRTSGVTQETFGIAQGTLGIV